ncbi:hypothetical protein [Enterococcus thailandicus]|uniref:hypothetical protein n=1 Tax=Enterococcus thailandicus TaxID=417368 RepID=UPI0022E5F62D|nr:hypothetical protein [Enterococcus thailandicus]MDT2753145.1 hypothetical protein [Enterococcus thailandicus]
MSKVSKREKKKARMKLLLLMDSDPKWDRKPEKRKLRNQLMSIIDDSFVPNDKVIISPEERAEEYLNNHPELEIEVVEAIKNNMTKKQIKEYLSCTDVIINAVRRRNDLEERQASHFNEDEKTIKKVYQEQGISGLKTCYGISTTTAYKWINKYKLPKKNDERIYRVVFPDGSLKDFSSQSALAMFVGLSKSTIKQKIKDKTTDGEGRRYEKVSK